MSALCVSQTLFLTLFTQRPDIKKVLTSQRTFDSEGEKKIKVFLLFFYSRILLSFYKPNNLSLLNSNYILGSKLAEEELYQNYQEKALHNDSDEDADSRGPKPDNGIVVQYKPIRTSWSQLTVVRLEAPSLSSSLYIQDTNWNIFSMHLWLCLRSSGMLTLPGMLSRPVWLQSIPILQLPLCTVCLEYRSIFFK